MHINDLTKARELHEQMMLLDNEIHNIKQARDKDIERVTSEAQNKIDQALDRREVLKHQMEVIGVDFGSQPALKVV